MDEQLWDELVELLKALRRDAVMRLRKAEATVEEITRRTQQVEKLRRKSCITVLKQEGT